MAVNAIDVFQTELPEIAASVQSLVGVLTATPALDAKTKQLIHLAIETANRNPLGVRLHARMARQAGATRAEVVTSVAMNLHWSGLVTVLDALPAAVEGWISAG